MIGIFRASWGCFVANWWLYLGFAILMEFMPLLTGNDHSIAATFFPQTIFAYFLHRHFLFGESVSSRKASGSSGTEPFRIGRFILVSAAIVGLPVVLGLVIMTQAFPATLQGDRDHLILALLATILPLYLLFLGFFGTALPATVERTSIPHVLSRGYRLGLGVMWRLLLGPALTATFLLVVISMGASAWGALAFKVLHWPVLATSEPTRFSFAVLGSLDGMFATTLAVAILCDAYRKIVPETAGVARPA